MSLHEQIAADMQRFVDDRADCAIIAPSAIAAAIYGEYAVVSVDAHVEYAAMEHLKGMARRVLAGRYDVDGEDSPAYTQQGEMFSGRLQERYPVATRKGEDRVYKLLADLTADDVSWNVNSLRRSANSRQAHADRLEAWAQERARVVA